ncbi:unnamed protein product [Closterium sp. NIES-53]
MQMIASHNTLYDAKVAHYSSPATAALGRLLLPYLFPELSAFATVEDLVSHLRTSVTCYRAALPAEFLSKNPPPTYITLYFIVTRGVRNHFLALDPTDLIVDLLKQHLLAAETSVVALLPLVGSAAPTRARVAGVVEVAAGVVVGVAVEVVEVVEVVAAVEVVAGVGTWVAVVEAAVGVAAVAVARVVAIGLDLGVEVLEEARGSGSSVRARAHHPSSFHHLTPLPAHVLVRLADPSGCPVVARSSIVLPCLAVLSGSLSGLHLPSFSTNLVSTTSLQDAMVTTTTPGGSSLYTLATEPPQVVASAQVSASGQVTPPCSCRLLSHQTLLWHHRLGHPSLPHLCGMHSRLLVSGFPRSLPPLPPSPSPPCLPCVEGRQRTAPHSSSFPPMIAPLQTLHMDVKGEVVDVLIPWIRAVRLQLRERFHADLLVLRLHFDRGGEFSSDLLRDFCRGEGILQSFTVPESPQKNGIAERRIGLVMEVARTSMIHAAAPHFLWPYAVRYDAHQLNLWPRVSLPETSPTLCWTRKVGDVSVFWVRGSRAFVHDTSADKLSARAIPCAFLGFSPDAPGWQFYHPTSRCVFPSQDIIFYESIPFYRLFPYRSAPPPPPPLFLAPGPPPVDPLPPKGPAPLGVSHVDPLPGTAPIEVALGSGAARGAASGGAEPGGAEFEGSESGGAEFEGAKSGGVEPGGVEWEGAGSRGAEPNGEEPRGAEPEGVEPGSAELVGAESGGAEPWGAASCGGPAGVSPRLSPQQLREWLVRRARLRSGATRAGGVGDAGAGGGGVTSGAGGPGGSAAAGPRGARTEGSGAAGTGGVGGAGAGDPTKSGAAGAGGAGAGGTGARGAGGSGAGGAGAGGAGAGGSGARGAGAGAGGTGAGGAGAGGAGAVHPGDTVQPRPYFVPLLQQVLGVPSSPSLPPPLLCPSPDQSQLPLQPASPLPAPSPYTEQSGSLTKRRQPASRPVSPVRIARCVPRSRPPPVLGIHAMFLYYTIALLAESVSASPPSVGGECALGTDVIEDRQDNFECLAAAVPRFTSMLLAPEGDPDAPDIPTPRSYAEAMTGPYSSHWQAFMDAEMASWKSTATYVDEVPPPGANIVDGMWIYRGVEYFQTFSPTPKMTTLLVLLHVAAQRDYKLHSLEFSTAFLQDSLHEEIRLRRPPSFTGTTLAALGFAPSTADPSLFLRTDTSLPLFYALVYIDDLVFATCDTEALTLVKSKLQKRHTCIDLGPSALRLPVLLATAHSSVYRPLALSSTFWTSPTSGMGLVLGGRGPVVLTGHADASWVDDSATSSCEAEIYAGAMAAQELRWITYLLTDLGEQLRLPPQRGQLRLAYLATRANTADIFTKALPPGDHQRFSTVLGLVPTLPHLLSA